MSARILAGQYFLTRKQGIPALGCRLLQTLLDKSTCPPPVSTSLMVLRRVLPVLAFLLLALGLTDQTMRAREVAREQREARSS